MHYEMRERKSSTIQQKIENKLYEHEHSKEQKSIRIQSKGMQFSNLLFKRNQNGICHCDLLAFGRLENDIVF